VLVVFSVIGNNIPNTYSTGLSIQALGRPFAMIPRFFWVFLSFVIYTIAGVAGREHFSAILSNFLAILSYWTAFFVVIVAEEHFLFRRKGGVLGGYNLADWDNPSKLPLGIAGILAACFGVAGAVVGMAQVWYIGPIGKLAGEAYGADLGFELAAGFATVTYPLCGGWRSGLRAGDDAGEPDGEVVHTTRSCGRVLTVGLAYTMHRYQSHEQRIRNKQ